LIHFSKVEILWLEPGIRQNRKLLLPVFVSPNTRFRLKRLLRSPYLTYVEVLNPLHFTIMNTPENEFVATQRWDDIVFENRNQEYGAYQLRKRYSFNMFVGVAITISVVVLVFALPILSKLFANESDRVVTVPKKLVYTELMAPPPIDKPKPPPPQVLLPKLQKVIKFVPPRVVKEQVIDEVPTMEELKVNEVAAVAVDGETDIVFEEPVEEVVAENPDEIFTVVEQQPEFAGGYDALTAYLRTHMQYPKLARKMGIEGTVHVSFLVSKTGSISEVKVLRGISAECDKEAIRVVEKMPAWTPGKQNGHPVHVRLVMPLKFRLN
jgi:periplasmic protein TonB